jgi:6-phosphogluconolactonase
MAVRGMAGRLLIGALMVASFGCGSDDGGKDSSRARTAYITLAAGNSIAAFQVNRGTLQAVVGAPFQAGPSPVSIVAHPSGKFVYVANADENDISLFSVDSSTRELKEVMPRTPAGTSPDALTIDSAGSFLFVANRLSNNISVYAINSGDGTLQPAPGSPVPTGLAPVSLLLTPSNKYLYVASGNLGLVFAYTLNNGALQPVPNSPFPAGGNPFGLAVDPGEHFLYATNFSEKTVTGLSINQSTGGLSIIPGFPLTVGTTPVAVLVHPSGKFLYVVNLGSNNISAFTLDATGFATALTSAPTASVGTQPLFIVSNSSGGTLFVGNQGGKSITQLTVDTSTGQLTTATTTNLSSAPSSMVLLN